MSTPATAAGGAPPPRIFGKARLVFLLALVALLVLCLILSWVTRGAMANLAFLRAHKGAANQSLVDLGPWQTAQTLASLAVTAEETGYAREAERLADHEVDQAFAAALRTAQRQSRRRVLTGEALTLSQKVAQLQQQIAQDKLLVDQLKGKPGSAPATAQNAAHQAEGSDALQVATAQLGLDSDELADVQSDLDRATGDLSVRIQNELAAHEAAMHKYDAEQRSGGEIAVVSANSHHTLAARLKSWFDQRAGISPSSRRRLRHRTMRARSVSSTTPWNRKPAQARRQPRAALWPVFRIAASSARSSPSTTTASRPISNWPRSMANGAIRCSCSIASCCISSCSRWR